jgi:hypothetical protein
VAKRARATAAGVTAQQARRLRERPAHRSSGSASLRTTCHQAQRLARRSSRPEQTQRSGGPAPGMAGGRGDDLARTPHTKRSATQCSAAPCAAYGPVRRAGPSVAKARRTWGPAIPGRGKGRRRNHRRRSRPNRVGRGTEARQGRDAKRLDAQHDGPTSRSGDAPPSWLRSVQGERLAPHRRRSAPSRHRPGHRHLVPHQDHGDANTLYRFLPHRAGGLNSLHAGGRLQGLKFKGVMQRVPISAASARWR